MCINIRLLDIHDLSEILSVTPKTIHNYLQTNPDKLPKQILLPNSKKHYWHAVEVQSWILSGNLTQYLTPDDIQKRLDDFWCNQ